MPFFWIRIITATSYSDKNHLTLDYLVRKSFASWLALVFFIINIISTPISFSLCAFSMLLYWLKVISNHTSSLDQLAEDYYYSIHWLVSSRKRHTTGERCCLYNFSSLFLELMSLHFFFEKNSNEQASANSRTKQ